MKSTMIKITFVLLATLILPAYSVKRCNYGCTCFDDSNCEYYCNGFSCQFAISLNGKCSGHDIHPRECGTVSYCDPNSKFTCQFQKFNGEKCVFSYSCLSEYCDPDTRSCQYKPTSSNWLVYVLLPGVVVFAIIILLLVSVIICRQRRRFIAHGRGPSTVIPMSDPYEYRRSQIITEAPPPPYPGTISPSWSKTYQQC